MSKRLLILQKRVHKRKHSKDNIAKVISVISKCLTHICNISFKNYVGLNNKISTWIAYTKSLTDKQCVATWTISFTPLCLSLSEETVKAIGPFCPTQGNGKNL